MASRTSHISCIGHGLLFALAAVLGLAPMTAMAQMDEGGLLFARAEHCLDIVAFESGGLRSQLTAPHLTPAPVKRAASFAPCKDAGGDSDPAHNICFEGTPAPISTLPSLLAKLQGEAVSAHILASIQVMSPEYDHEAGSEFSALSRAQSTRSARLEPVSIARDVLRAVHPERDGGEGESCTYDPVQCRPLAPLPTTLTLASTPPASTRDASLLEPPPTLNDLPQQDAWASLRVGSSLEHRHPLHRPPIG